MKHHIISKLSAFLLILWFIYIYVYYYVFIYYD